jgi:glycogen debranching enzyme
MGPFITAYVKVNDGKRAGRARSRAAEFLSEFAKHLNEAGLGQVSEIFDGDAPHAPRGCIAQAWSVAELLRAAIEDVFEQQPSARRAKSA